MLRRYCDAQSGRPAQEVCPFDCAGDRCVAPALDLCVVTPERDCGSDFALDFGVLETGMQAAIELELGNTGDALLTVQAITVDETDAVVLPATLELPLVLEPSRTHRFEVALQARTIGAIEGTLAVRCDDPERAAVSVPIRATVVPVPTLEIGIDSGDGAFVPLADGDTLTYARGFQGLGDIWISFRASGLGASGRLGFEMRSGTALWVGLPPLSVSFTEGPGGSLVILRRRYTVEGEANPAVLEGAEANLIAEYTDNEGRRVDARVRVNVDVLAYP